MKSSPGIKEDTCYAVTSAEKLREGEWLHGTPPSPGPQGQCVPRGADVGGLAQTSDGDWGASEGVSQMLHQGRSLWNSG